MKKLFSLSFLVNILAWISFTVCFAQVERTTLSDTDEIISAVIKAQSKIRTVYFSVTRTDTLVTGETRTFTGRAKIRVDTEDYIFGFKFWSKQDGDNSEQVYNGNIGYLVNVDDKSYSLISKKDEIQRLMYNGGARLIATDFVKLDTSQASKIMIVEHDDSYDVVISYPDILKYSVTERRKIVTIAKSSLLPLTVRIHQETLGKVQDLYYKIEEAKINDPTFHYDYTSPIFLKDFVHSFPKQSKSLAVNLKGKMAPPFELQTFDGKTISNNDTDGKVMLLDFWEVWCGPCIESIPKVQRLYEKYKDSGLMVYGITNDLKQLQTAKLLATKEKIQFPMLIGNERLRNDYKFNGTVPLYILIDKAGKIVLISEGYPANLEDVIKDLL